LGGQKKANKKEGGAKIKKESKSLRRQESKKANGEKGQ
jgi:hypothetical protein